jgi:tRNA(Ile)-lysidine synthase
MERIEQKFLRFIDEHGLIGQGEKILVGFSGGPDSVFLLHLLNKYSGRLKIKVSAVHINHSLRGKEAGEDEKFCREFCLDRKINFVSVKKNVKAYSGRHGFSLEEGGRILRYKEYEKTLKQNKLDKIATAHNANDNTETVLLNLIKGTGLDGISGIPIVRDNVIRPVLCFTKEEILSYLERNKILFRTDRSNEESNYERNYLRNRVLPLIKERINPSIDSAVLVSSENFRNIRDYILVKESETFKNLKKDASGSLKIPVADMYRAKEELKGFLLKTKLERELEIPIFSDDIKKIFSLTSLQAGKQIELSGGIIVFRERGYLKIVRRFIEKDNYSVRISAGEKKITPAGRLSIKKCSRNTLSDEFTIRRWKEGDTFHPLGMKGSKKVSDFLNEQKVESSGKKNHLILLNGNKVVWVIGFRIDERFKITPSTQKMLELCLN